MEGVYQNILDAKFDPSTKGGGGEFVNILNDYRWTLDGSSGASAMSDSGISYSGQIPFVYATEYRQMYSSQITNMVNSILSLGNIANDKTTKDLAKAVNNLIDSLGKAQENSAALKTEKAKSVVNSVAQATGDFLNNTLSGWVDAAESMASNIYNNSHLKNSDLLSPYVYLYATRATRKYFIFPLLTPDAAQFTIQNSFGDSASDTNTTSSVLKNGLTEMLTSVPQMINGVVNDISQLSNFVSGLSGDSTSQFVNNWVEMGKFYKYSTEGDKVKIVFPLFNTVKKDEWKRHHRFIFNFAIRNMPFKVDSASYHQPVLYDVIIPGVKRMPFAFVNSFNVQPYGTIRALRGENYISEMVYDKSSTVAFNIPEAWMVTIEFTDLLGPSANKMLSGFIDMPI